LAPARMGPTTLNRLYGILPGVECDLVYSGSFPDEHSPRLILLAEELAGRRSGNERLSRKLAFILVEAYQNILRHRAPVDPVDELAARSVFMLNSTGSAHLVTTTNPLRREEQAGLRSILEKLDKNSDLRQLKEMFLRGLQGTSTSTRGGAGLGLIEMARRSSTGLHHEFIQENDHPLMFSLQLATGRSAQDATFERLHAMRELIGELNALLIFKGRPTPGMQSALLRMIATELAGDEALAERGSGIFFGMMETIAELGPMSQPPMIMLRRHGLDHALSITVGLPRADADLFEARTNELLQQDQRVTERMYRDALIGRSSSTHFNKGLLDLARRMRSPLHMEKFPLGNDSILHLELVI
jgi:hypothetical protein